jgi:hypothetical protein
VWPRPAARCGGGAKVGEAARVGGGVQGVGEAGRAVGWVGESRVQIGQRPKFTCQRGKFRPQIGPRVTFP